MNILHVVKALTATAAIAAGSIASAAGEETAGRDSNDWLRGGGVVYTMDNAATGNSILVFARDRAGRLHPIRGAAAGTGGAGAANNAAVDPLGSQNSLVYDAALDMLFAVNAGDNTVTAFHTGQRGVRLRRADRDASGGLIPVSLAVSE